MPAIGEFGIIDEGNPEGTAVALLSPFAHLGDVSTTLRPRGDLQKFEPECDRIGFALLGDLNRGRLSAAKMWRPADAAQRRGAHSLSAIKLLAQ